MRARAGQAGRGAACREGGVPARCQCTDCAGAAGAGVLHGWGPGDATCMFELVSQRVRHGPDVLFGCSTACHLLCEHWLFPCCRCLCHGRCRMQVMHLTPPLWMCHDCHMKGSSGTATTQAKAQWFLPAQCHGNRKRAPRPHSLIVPSHRTTLPQHRKADAPHVSACHLYHDGERAVHCKLSQSSPSS